MGGRGGGWGGGGGGCRSGLGWGGGRRRCREGHGRCWLRGIDGEGLVRATGVSVQRKFEPGGVCLDTSARAWHSLNILK